MPPTTTKTWTAMSRESPAARSLLKDRSERTATLSPDPTIKR